MPFGDRPTISPAEPAARPLVHRRPQRRDTRRADGVGPGGAILARADREEAGFLQAIAFVHVRTQALRHLLAVCRRQASGAVYSMPSTEQPHWCASAPGCRSSSDADGRHQAGDDDMLADHRERLLGIRSINTFRRHISTDSIDQPKLYPNAGTEVSSTSSAPSPS
jgi:hypothetical protein